jgi:hypothetical protein
VPSSRRRSTWPYRYPLGGQPANWSRVAGFQDGVAACDQRRLSNRRRADRPAAKALRDNQIPPRTMTTISRTSSQRIPSPIPAAGLPPAARLLLTQGPAVPTILRALARIWSPTASRLLRATLDVAGADVADVHGVELMRRPA